MASVARMAMTATTAINSSIVKPRPRSAFRVPRAAPGLELEAVCMARGLRPSISLRASSGVDVDHHFAGQRVEPAVQLFVGDRRRHDQQRSYLERVPVVGGFEDLR